MWHSITNLGAAKLGKTQDYNIWKILVLYVIMISNKHTRKEGGTSMTKIASNLGAAQAAVTGIQRISTESSGTVTMVLSNVNSMKDGTQVANELLSNLNQLVDCVKVQADKFPQIAKIIALRDSQAEFKAGEK